ncbi:MAG: PAS domain S-box protein, partial [Dehalococcoidia bacterium]
MRDTSELRRLMSGRLTVLGLVAAVLFWVIHAAAESLLHHETSFVGQLFFMDPSEIWEPALASLLFVGGSVYAQVLVNQRRSAEDALERREKYYQALGENSSDGIAVLASDGTIRYEGASLERVSGYKPEEMTDAALFGLIHPDDVAEAARLFDQIVQDPGHILQTELR